MQAVADSTIVCSKVGCAGPYRSLGVQFGAWNNSSTAQCKKPKMNIEGDRWKVNQMCHKDI